MGTSAIDPCVSPIPLFVMTYLFSSHSCLCLCPVLSIGWSGSDFLSLVFPSELDMALGLVSSELGTAMCKLNHGVMVMHVHAYDNVICNAYFLARTVSLMIY